MEGKGIILSLKRHVPRQSTTEPTNDPTNAIVVYRSSFTAQASHGKALMIALRRLKPFSLPPLGGSTSSHQYGCLQDSKVGSNRRKKVPRSQPQRPSLLEELFPEDGYSSSVSSKPKDQDLPRLPLPEVDEFFEEFQGDLDHSRDRPSDVTKTAAAHAFRHQKLAVLALHIASKSLIESDFRRVAPKGKHIDDWTGPGDILKGRQADSGLTKCFF